MAGSSLGVWDDHEILDITRKLSRASIGEDVLADVDCPLGVDGS